MEVARYTAHELTFESVRDHGSPFWDVDLRVELVSPSGRRVGQDAFWDGGRTWRARVRPDETGTWHWRSVASDDGDRGLHGGEGTFDCVVYDGPNPVFRHGPVRVSDDGSHFAHADGMPFLWMGDTVWNGLIRSTPAAWDEYLDTRRAQGFSVVQFFSSHWRALAGDPFGEPSYREDGEGGRFSAKPAFYQRLDPKVESVARHGMLASAIVVLSLFDEEPGWAWPPEQLVRFARWMRARWGAYHVAWSIGGDGDFSGERAQRWRLIGAAFAADPPEALVTLHPRGWTTIADEFRDEPWFTFHVYQSGHTDVEDRVRWLPEGPYTKAWRAAPAKPFINIEPNYDDHPSYASGIRFTAHEVRRASYWSLLVTPTAGVSYGHFSLWAWSVEPEPVGTAIARQSDYLLEPWWTVLDTEGSRSFTLVRRYFESGPWWLLRPAQELLLEQPGAEDSTRFVTVAKTPVGDWTVAYTPRGAALRIRGNSGQLGHPRWFDPRTGYWRTASSTTLDDVTTFTAPSDDDWVLDLRR